MNDRYGLIVLAVTLVGALSVAGCGKSEKVHESWVEPPAQGQVDDSTLNSTIKAALLADPEVRHLDVKVEANDGKVMLSGFADNETQLERVNMLTWMAEGVKKVDNKMSVRSGAAPADTAGS
ncbi:BON domain-containing protein [Nitrosovibrio sp. Nv6]|uniref:BON domain-containing protein n=1 Tax=Nitrosovibrio sp. Nv6 TaxID=1855340 RepID=UPI0008CBC4C5|nr:BON domain-containing protein [Nitrosovibrio sp. Nv6]SEP39083.1 hyperosmotically inducible protein [Nitrosovibrio sp. Nv6]